MINENGKILKLNIKDNNSYILKKLEEYYEGFNALFYFILKNPLDNFWWECISLSFQYAHMLIFIVNGTVRFKYFLSKI